MDANSVTAPATDKPGIPLDLEPLLEPHLQQGRLSVRVERLPLRARLSKGHNNGDGTFSLKPDDLADLYYLPPDGTADPAANLAVRIVKLDDDYAITLDLLDLAVPAETQTKEPKKRTIRFSGTPERRKDQTVVQLDTARPQARAEPEPAPPPAAADAQVETAKLQRAFDVLSHSLAQTEARAEDAERQAEAAVAENVALTARATEAEAAVTTAREDAKVLFEAELSELRAQLDTAATDVDEVHKRALDAAAAAHQREIGNLQSAHARELDARIAATQKELESAFDDRLAAALREAAETAEATLNEAHKAWEAKAAADLAAAREHSKTEGAQQQAAATADQLQREFADRLAKELGEAEKQAEAALAADHEAWRAEEAERLAAAEKEFEIELARLRQQLDDAAKNFDEMRKQALDDAAAKHEREIKTLQKTHANALKKEIKATEKKLEKAFADRLADERRRAKDTTKAESTKTRDQLTAQAEATLAAAREQWQAEETKRTEAASKEFEIELARLRQQLDDAAKNFDEMRQQALDAAATDHAREIAELEQQQAAALDAQSKEISKKLEQAFADRLADELHQAKETATAELEAARATWESGSDDEQLAQAVREAEETAEADLEKARQEWQAETEAKLAAAQETWKDEEAAEAELEKARQEWQAETEAKLAAAQETWKVEEAERLAAALKVWESQPQKSSVAATPKKVWRPPSLPRMRVPLRLPPRSLVVKLAIVGALGLGLLHPEVKSRLPAAQDFIGERSAIAATELRIYFDPLISKVTGSDPLPEAMPPPRDDVFSEALIESVRRTTIGVGRANIRSGPSTGAAVVATITRGTELTVLRSQGSWRQVRFGEGINGIGWVHRDLLGATP